MNPDAVTIQDCEENFYRKNQAVILAAGKVVGFTDDCSEIKQRCISLQNCGSYEKERK